MKKKRSIRGSISGSIHASSIISSSEEDVRESLKAWFDSSLALPGYFQLPEIPVSALQAGCSRDFLHYKSSIEALGVGVWDIQETGGDTVSVLLEDSNGVQKKLSGRGDFIISSRKAAYREAASLYALCSWNLTLQRWNMSSIGEIRDGTADSVYESNGKFQLYQIADVLPQLLRGVND